jgi:CheY-like chemotaxis protein
MHPRCIIASEDVAEEANRCAVETGYQIPIVSWRSLMLSNETSEWGNVILYLMKPVSAESLHYVMQQVEREPETTILLVDDDREAVRLMENMLNALPRPYRILRAYDGHAALSAVREYRPDIVFIDLLLPGLSGEEVITSMWGDARTRDIPVVIVSAKDLVRPEVSLAMPITIRCAQPMSLSQSIRCTQAIVSALSADYLAGGAPSAAS